jgi:hypothetical protein
MVRAVHLALSIAVVAGDIVRHLGAICVVAMTLVAVGLVAVGLVVMSLVVMPVTGSVALVASTVSRRDGVYEMTMVIDPVSARRHVAQGPDGRRNKHRKNNISERRKLSEQSLQVSLG